MPRRLLGLVDRMRRTARAMAQGLNAIARQRLLGVDLARLAPAGFNPTATHYLIVEAVSWTLALRQRLLPLVVRRAFVPAMRETERAPQARGETSYLPVGVAAVPDDDHDWVDLATPWRMGPGGVAVAARNMEGLSAGEAVEQICDKQKRATVQLGADADVARIAAMEAAARALCPEPEAVTQVEPEAQPEPEPVATAEPEPEPVATAEPEPEPEAAAKDDVEDLAAGAGGSGSRPGARAAEPPADDEPESGKDDDPPPKPPD